MLSAATVKAVCPTGLRILLVEDNPINQLVARRVLERRGHSITVAGTGEAAIDFVLSGEFDLVLMDIQMPGMDGWEATVRIRDAQANRGYWLPVIAWTTYARGEDLGKCAQAGMDGFLEKPLELDSLDALLAEVARAARRPAQQRSL